MSVVVSILERAALIAVSGGDPHPETCPIEAGRFCARCLCAMARGQIDNETQAGLDDNDGALKLATNYIRRSGDDGIAHSDCESVTKVLLKAVALARGNGIPAVVDRT